VHSRIEAALDGIEPFDWQVRRRRLAEAAGSDGFVAAWQASDGRLARGCKR